MTSDQLTGGVITHGSVVDEKESHGNGIMAEECFLYVFNDLVVGVYLMKLASGPDITGFGCALPPKPIDRR
jgi:hypothetical protein